MSLQASKFPRRHHYSDGQKTGHESIMLKLRHGVSNENRRETRTYKIHMRIKVSMWMYKAEESSVKEHKRNGGRKDTADLQEVSGKTAKDMM